VFLAIVGGAALAFYALIGFEDSVNVAEEVREPGRAFPRALFGGLAIAGVVYLLVTLSASLVVPTDQLSGSSGPLLEVVREGPIDLPLKLFAFIALLAVANGALINMIMASRLVYGMARRELVPAAFGRVLRGRRTPHVAIAFTTAIAVVLISTGDLGELADTTVVLLLAVFAIVNVTVLVLRRDPVDHEHFRAPASLPALGALVSVVLLVDRVGGDPVVGLRAAGLVGLGALLWLVAYPRRPPRSRSSSP
jgi:amino acid transporter